MRELGRQVKARRLSLGLSQGQVSGAVGRSHGWLSNLENGKGGEVPAEILAALAIELSQEPADYLRLAGRAILKAEDVVPVGLDPRLAATIERAVERSFERFGDRLVERLTELLEQRRGEA